MERIFFLPNREGFFFHNGGAAFCHHNDYHVNLRVILQKEFRRYKPLGTITICLYTKYKQPYGEIHVLTGHRSQSINLVHNIQLPLHHTHKQRMSRNRLTRSSSFFLHLICNGSVVYEYYLRHVWYDPSVCLVSSLPKQEILEFISIDGISPKILLWIHKIKGPSTLQNLAMQLIQIN